MGSLLERRPHRLVRRWPSNGRAVGLDVLVVENISKRYGNTVALDNVSFDVRAGEVHALVGENGSGKSTLCKVLFGDHAIRDTGGHGGQILLDGEPVAFRSSHDALNHGMALVHQEMSLVPEMSVAENVTLGNEPLKGRGMLASVDRRMAERFTIDALASLGVSIDPAAITGELPVGAQQLVEAAREFSRAGVKVLVLDEPSAALSTAESESLVRMMRSLADTGVAVLFVSHRLREVLDVADRITVLRDGRLVGTVERGSADAVGLIRMMVGEDSADSVRRHSSIRDSDALRMHSVNVPMPGDPLRDLSLEVKAGEIVGVTSQSGHGRLALCSGLLGFYPIGGALFIDGAEVFAGDPVRLERAGMSVIHEDRRYVGLDLNESVALNIALPSLVAGRRFVKLGWLPGGGFADEDAIREAAVQLIERFDIRCSGPLQPVGELSGGNQQKVAIGRGVASEPSVLMVSEPTRGIDVRAKDMVLSALGSIADEGVGVVVVSGEVLELERICDRIIVLRDGRVKAEFSPPFSEIDIELAVLGESAEALA